MSATSYVPTYSNTAEKSKSTLPLPGKWLRGLVILLASLTRPTTEKIVYYISGLSCVLSIAFFILTRTESAVALIVGGMAMLCILLARRMDDISDSLSQWASKMLSAMEQPISSEINTIPQKEDVAAKYRSVDNVGNVFFSTSSETNTNVFRLSCELRELVNGKILSQALQITTKAFPFFQVEAEKGAFWNRLKQSELTPVALPEFGPTCGRIYHKNAGGLLYDVTWSGNKINMDTFHALTDATGASYFLRMVVTSYLFIMRGEEISPEILTGYYGLTPDQYESDDFQKYYTKKNLASDTAFRKAYQFKAEPLPQYRNTFIKGEIKTDAILTESRRRIVTVTELFAAIYMKAIAGTMSEEDKALPVVISIPVNLRKYYPSQTAKNFFTMVNIRYNFSTGSDDLDAITASIHSQLLEQLVPESLEANFSRFVALENNAIVRHVPLALKNISLKFAGKQSDQCITSVFSNMGQPTMLDEFASDIVAYDFLDRTEGVKLCVASYQNTMRIHFASALTDNTVISAFFSGLGEIGFDVKAGYCYPDNMFTAKPLVVAETYPDQAAAS